jgi:hypothetical protein
VNRAGAALRAAAHSAATETHVADWARAAKALCLEVAACGGRWREEYARRVAAVCSAAFLVRRRSGQKAARKPRRTTVGVIGR